MSKLLTLLSAVTLIWGYSVYRYGGVLTGDILWTALSLGAVGLIWWLTARTPGTTSLAAPVWAPILLLPLYLGFQLLPLPAGLLQHFSPARWELLLGMTPVFGPPTWAPLSAAPAATVSHVIRVLVFATMFLLVREAMANSRRRPWLIAAPLIAIGALEAAFGLAQFASRTDLEFARGTFLNRNHFAGMLAMVLPFAAISAVNLFRSSETRRARVGYALAAIFGGIMGLGILQSLSRMGFLAMACSLVTMLAVYGVDGVSPLRRWWGLGLIALLLALCTLLSPTQRIMQRLLETGTENSSLTRVDLWASAINLWRHYPVFGSGAGSFQSVVPRYELSPMNYTADYAHNDYLQGMAEFGIVGFCIPACFMAYMLKLAIQNVRFGASNNIRSIALACFGALIAILVHSLADFNFYIPANMMLVSWICGMIAGLPELRRVAPKLNA